MNRTNNRVRTTERSMRDSADCEAYSCPTAMLPLKANQRRETKEQKQWRHQGGPRSTLSQLSAETPEARGAVKLFHGKESADELPVITRYQTAEHSPYESSLGQNSFVGWSVTRVPARPPSAGLWSEVHDFTASTSVRRLLSWIWEERVGCLVTATGQVFDSASPRGLSLGTQLEETTLLLLARPRHQDEKQALNRKKKCDRRTVRRRKVVELW